MSKGPIELVCPAGTPAALRAAVDAGADAVYAGFRDQTNARNFPGLNFSRTELREGIAYARERGCKLFVAINTYPEAGNLAPWHAAVDDAAHLGADAVILADLGLLDYAARRHPALRRPPRKSWLGSPASRCSPTGSSLTGRDIGAWRPDRMPASERAAAEC